MMKKLRVLHIEDDAIEVMKLQRTIKSLALEHEVIVANNGEEALELLAQKNQLPDIILLDLNMPKLNGIEFLKILKSDEVLQFIPSIILSTSVNQTDLLECYKTGIAGYIVKPLKYEDYMAKIESVLSYWSKNEFITRL